MATREGKKIAPVLYQPEGADISRPWNRRLAQIALVEGHEQAPAPAFLRFGIARKGFLDRGQQAGIVLANRNRLWRVLVRVKKYRIMRPGLAAELFAELDPLLAKYLAGVPALAEGRHYRCRKTSAMVQLRIETIKAQSVNCIIRNLARDQAPQSTRWDCGRPRG